jgi:uncharacterized protein YbjT (DUF2867 family)
MKINAIVFGATGMVGEGVLHECLLHPEVEPVLVIGRRPSEMKHEKMKEIVQKDLFDLSAMEEQLKGYNACYFCLGVSSIGMNETDYTRITYDLTMSVAKTLSRLNPEMTFCYVSGTGTDSSERGSSMWARVKGKTENDLTKLPFKSVYNFRPGFIKPIKGLKNTLAFAKPLAPLYPLLKFLFPNAAVTLHDVGIAMINTALYGYEKTILECKDITKLAQSFKH